MNWTLIIIAGLFETGFATCLGKAKYSSGQTQLWWMAGFFGCLIISMYLLYRATQTLPIGTAYAVWTGIGAIGTVIVGIIWFNEQASFLAAFFPFDINFIPHWTEAGDEIAAHPLEGRRYQQTGLLSV